MSSVDLDEEVEAFIREAFEENYEQLRIESGRAITPDGKETALNEVLLYWRKLRDVAESITDTEVRLTFPNNVSPRGRDFSIQGVVDLLRDGEQTWMYDIKTHDADLVRANLRQYEQQLNVYAFIWHELRRQDLDGMAIIATDYPDAIKEALSSRDPLMIQHALEEWNPVVPIDYNPEHVKETIQDFACVVDQIEDGEFTPRPVEALRENLPGSGSVRFATRVCGNCDGRFSCSSYRQYARNGNRRSAESAPGSQYWGDFPESPDQESWRTAGLEAAQPADDLRKDFAS